MFEAKICRAVLPEKFSIIVSAVPAIERARNFRRLPATKADAPAGISDLRRRGFPGGIRTACTISEVPFPYCSR